MREMEMRFLDDRVFRSCRVVMVRFVVVAVIAASFNGCDNERPLAPVTGKVTYRGEPLKFGTVMFQPPSGQPATASIQPDGTFALETRGEGEGAAVGMCKVRVTCYEGQNPVSRSAPSGDEGGFGKSLIPEKYLDYDTSEITVEVKPGINDPVTIELKDN